MYQSNENLPTDCYRKPLDFRFHLIISPRLQQTVNSKALGNSPRMFWKNALTWVLARTITLFIFLFSCNMKQQTQKTKRKIICTKSQINLTRSFVGTPLQCITSTSFFCFRGGGGGGWEGGIGGTSTKKIAVSFFYFMIDKFLAYWKNTSYTRSEAFHKVCLHRGWVNI